MATAVQLERCVHCKGKTREGTTTLEFTFDGVTVIIDGVSAMVCGSCEEAYINGPLGTAISEIATELAEKVSSVVLERKTIGGTTVRTHISDHSLVPSPAY